MRKMVETCFNARCIRCGKNTIHPSNPNLVYAAVWEGYRSHCAIPRAREESLPKAARELEYTLMSAGAYNSGNRAVVGCAKFNTRAETYVNNVLTRYAPFCRTRKMAAALSDSTREAAHRRAGSATKDSLLEGFGQRAPFQLRPPVRSTEIPRLHFGESPAPTSSRDGGVRPEFGRNAHLALISKSPREVQRAGKWKQTAKQLRCRGRPHRSSLRSKQLITTVRVALRFERSAIGGAHIRAMQRRQHVKHSVEKSLGNRMLPLRPITAQPASALTPNAAGVGEIPSRTVLGARSAYARKSHTVPSSSVESTTTGGCCSTSNE